MVRPLSLALTPHGNHTDACTCSCQMPEGLSKMQPLPLQRFCLLRTPRGDFESSLLCEAAPPFPPTPSPATPPLPAQKQLAWESWRRSCAHSLWSGCGSGYFVGSHRAGGLCFWSGMLLVYFATPLSGCEPPGLEEWGGGGGIVRAEGGCQLGRPELGVREGAFPAQQCFCLFARPE